MEKQLEQIELDPVCVHDGCHMPGVITLCVHFYMPESKLPQVGYFNAALCEYHRWEPAKVEQFLDDNWANITVAFGLGLTPERSRTEWKFVPWTRAVEFWRKAEAAMAKKATYPLMPTAVLWNGGSTNWDSALVRYVLDSAEQCEHFPSLDAAQELPQSSVVICIPGQHSLRAYKQINHAASFFDRVTFCIQGDEEALFVASRLDHPNKKVWWFAPPFHPKQEVDRVAIFGWPTGAREMIGEQKAIVSGARDFDWCFLGQVTHERRQQCVKATERMTRGYVLSTEGFSQGVPREEYYRYLCRSKIALCPSGNCTPDTFRLSEALEAQCVPIVEDVTRNPEYPAGYWRYAFGVDRLPFPCIDDWRLLPSIVDKVLFDYPHYYFRCAQFWAEYKARLVSWMREDLRR